MAISDNVKIVKDKIAAAALTANRKADDIILVAASKTKPYVDIREAIGAGITVLGENRVQEMTEKYAQNAYSGASLHFIGHLQTNKVNKVVGTADLIESVDSLDLLSLIAKRAGRLQIIQELLLQVNIAGETTKSGCSRQELYELLDCAGNFPSIRVRGLMLIPPLSRLSEENRKLFDEMHELFVDIGSKKYDNVSMDFLSMGMSGDYTDAILSGANMVRIGHAIFGTR